jgi:hypothetical protein
MIKVPYTGSSESFHEVVEGCSIPVVIAGGEKIETDKDILEMVKGAITAGGAGVSIGRNVFQHKDPEKIVKAISKIVHKGFSVEEHENDPVRDYSFDLVSLAFVLHGLPEALRRSVLGHAARIARQAVLVLDYTGHGPWYIRLIEFFEGPHYPSFAARPATELLAAAGLAVDAHGVTSPTGGYWLARPLRPTRRP